MTIFEQYPRPHPQTAGRVMDGEAVLILADASEIKVLNQVGSRIYELADGRHSVNEIVDVIVKEYDVSQSAAEADVT
ncbi:MAG: PqqD family protein, partial [Chloroflexota bacterium]